jgi:hypothetical protein
MGLVNIAKNAHFLITLSYVECNIQNIGPKIAILKKQTKIPKVSCNPLEDKP